VQDFTAAASGGEGKKFKIDPQRLLYSLQWKHNGSPPDFHLQLVRDPQLWFDFVATMLLGELKRHDPRLRETLAAVDGGDGWWLDREAVVQLGECFLDLLGGDFE
jgi:hypothetical protein